MGFRSLAACGLAVLLLGGTAAAPAAPAVPAAPAAPGGSAGDPSTDVPPVAPDRPNPGARFPRRPGAKYGDVERAPGRPADVGGVRLRLGGVRFVTAAAAPRRLRRGDARREAFTPRLDRPGGWLRVRVTGDPDPGFVECTATDPATGAAAVEYRRPGAPAAGGRYFPVGRTGTYDVACRARWIVLLAAGDGRAVWRVAT